MNFVGSLAVAFICQVFFIGFVVIFGCANKKSKSKEVQPKQAIDESEVKQIHLTPAVPVQPPVPAPVMPLTQVPSTKQSSTTAESEAKNTQPKTNSIAQGKTKSTIQDKTKSIMQKTDDKKSQPPALPIPLKTSTTNAPTTTDVTKDTKSEIKKPPTISQTPTTGCTGSKIMPATDDLHKTVDSTTTDLRTPAWMESEEYVQHKLEVQKQIAAGVH